MRYRGKLYRALNPIYAREPCSGQGAHLHGGRFNPKRMAALYCATSLHTALREANQVGDLQPTTILCYDADIETVFDGRDPDGLKRFGMTPAALADPTWRDQMKATGKARTQIFTEALMADGFDGLLVRSFARGATDDDINLIVWTWSDSAPSRLTLIDDEGRLATI
jgi:RES domain-containing protein